MVEGKDIKALVVDDEPFLVEIMKESLEMIGLEVTEAFLGSQALKIISENRVDMLVTDLNLPDIEGLEVIKSAKKINPDIICIAVTGHVRDYKYIDVIKAGAVDFVKKPFDIEELQVKALRALNERLHIQELTRLSQTDPLTGLLNRRSFFQRLREELKRSERQNYRVSVMMMDLDNFKEINDTKGHLEGDRLLMESAKIIRTKIRDSVDQACRYGGDEFAVMVVDAPEEVLERIATRIEEEMWSTLMTGVTVGWASHKRGQTAEELVNEADRRLLEKKDIKRATRGLKVLSSRN